MALVYSPNIIEIAVRYTIGTSPAVNVWHMWFDAELGSDTMEAVVGDFRDNWQDHIVPLQSTITGLNGFDWRSLDPDDTSSGTIPVDPLKPDVGETIGDSFPPNTALLIHKNTANRPRGRRDGRAYLGGIIEDWADGTGGVSSTAQTTVNTALTAFYNGISDTSGTASGDRYPAVLETTEASRTPGDTPVTITSRRVTSLTVDTVLATQRERMR